MNNLTDPQLLLEYAERHSEAAFAELVRRHVDLVYSAALRMVRDAHLAEDVAQGVFVAFAKNARQLTDRPVLSGWLHRTAQNLAANAVRSDVRRRAREQEAVTMNELFATEPDALWEHIAQHLDAALGELSELERDAILLRYFERKSASEMAQTLGVSDEAAQKRVSRAVERLREFLAKRGVTIGATGLVVVISANAVQAAPVGLAVAISAAAVVAGTILATSATATATQAIAMTTLQKILASVALATALSTGIYEARQISKLRNQIQTLQEENPLLAGQIRQLLTERDNLANRLAALAEIEKRKGTSSELLKLRSEVTRLQNGESQASDPTQSAAKLWLTRVAQLRQRLTEHPEAGIPELKLLTEEDWLAAAKDRHLETETDYRRALSTLRYAGENKFGSEVEMALQKYAQANNAGFPTELSQLQPYFDSPVDDAILQRWQITSAKTVPNLGFGSSIVTQKAAVDDLFDQRIAVGLNGFGSTDFLSSENRDAMQSMYKAFSDANNGQNPTDISQVLPFASTPEQRAAVEKWIQRNSLNK